MVSGPLAARISFILCRIVVPLWILSGALFKLIEGDPRNLPQGLRQILIKPDGTDPDLILLILIALEFLAVGVMLFLPRAARLMATFMLGCFCLILLNELRIGNVTSCGCFGSLTIPPWAILIVDGLLLTGVVLFEPAKSEKPFVSLFGLAGAGAWTAVLAIVAGVMLLGGNGGSSTNPPAPNGDSNQTPPVAVDPNGPGQIPTTYVMAEQTQIDSWPGRKWTDISMARYMPSWPDPNFAGKWYVIFYSPTCEHCQALLNENFVLDPPVPTILVAVPESKDAIDPRSWDVMAYCRECVREMTLPHGEHWLVDFPIVVAVEDNVVQCAKGRVEATGDNCLIWH
jgi:hypothetical protein